MTKAVGIDLGSRTTKIVRLVDGKIDRVEIFDTGHDPLPRVGEALEGLEPDYVVATGYGRHLVRENFGARHVTEIRACARGAFHLFPECRAILDVGGQDCKVISIDEKGRVKDFEMNDRCAAGTGRFLEVMANVFSMPLVDFVRMAQEAKDHMNITSMCTVFAESEVVTLVTSGTPKEKIARGLHVSIANRLSSMLARFTGEGDVLFVGGGAKNDCLHCLLEQKIGRTILRPEDPQTVVALGAALIAGETRDQTPGDIEL